MRRVQQALGQGAMLSTGVGDYLDRIVWDLYHEAKQRGLLRLKKWWLVIDFSDEVAALLLDWFGEDPLGRTP